jgi:hypothetical protein
MGQKYEFLTKPFFFQKLFLSLFSIKKTYKKKSENDYIGILVFWALTKKITGFLHLYSPVESSIK